MNTEKYIVRLSEEERLELQTIVKKLKGTSQKVNRAIALLHADADGPDWTNEQIAARTGLTPRSISSLRKKLVTEGFEVALHRTKRLCPSVPKKLDGMQEAKIIATRCGTPPEGFGKWTLRLLANQAVVLEIVDSISHETIRQTLKKKGLTTQKIHYWVRPPGSDAEFVAKMENVLDVYHRPFDPRFPVVVMDEQPIQLLRHTREVIPARPAINGFDGHPERIDYEYERNGTASIFLFIAPFQNGRRVVAREQRTKIELAEEVEQIVMHHFASSERVTIIWDNLNTHTMGAFYERYRPAYAREIVRRCEFVSTPVHGRWLRCLFVARKRVGRFDTTVFKCTNE